MNLPNILTLLRMLMVPAVIVCFAANHPLWALFFFLLASATDVLDGYLARKFNQITNFGKVMDPLADKLMLITTLICLYLTGRIPMWVPIVIGVKECTMITVAACLYRKDIILPSNFFGKLATVLFTVAVLISFFSARFNDKILRVINIVCGLVIVFYGAKLLVQFFHLVA